jgi:ADP-heptose:LPS heptosyltransferase
MSFKSKVNAIRGTIMHSLTKNIGNRGKMNLSVDLNPEKIRKILISRPNSRLGNQLLLTPLVQEIIRIFPNAKIDLFVRGGLAAIIFENYENVDRIIRLPKKPFKELIAYIGVWTSLRKSRYDIVINAVNDSSSGRLSTAVARAQIKLYGNEYQEIKNKYQDYVHIAKKAIYNLRYHLSRLGFEVNNMPLPVLDIKLTSSELAKGKILLDNLVSREKKTITLYTYATGGKCYSESWWLTLYKKLKDRYDDEYNIIEMLPVENVSQITFKAPSFYSKNIREMAALMANTEVYIGADCGVMHLASAAKIPVIGLFSITNPNIYRPYNTGSIAINTNHVTRADDLLRIIEQTLNSSQLSMKN